MALLHQDYKDASLLEKVLQQTSLMFKGDNFGNMIANGIKPYSRFLTSFAAPVVFNGDPENDPWTVLCNMSELKAKVKEPNNITLTSSTVKDFFCRILEKSENCYGLPCKSHQITDVRVKFNRRAFSCTCCTRFWFCNRKFHSTNLFNRKTGTIVCNEKVLQEADERESGIYDLKIIFSIARMVVKKSDTGHFTLYVTANEIVGGRATLQKTSPQFVSVSDEEFNKLKNDPVYKDEDAPSVEVVDDETMIMNIAAELEQDAEYNSDTEVEQALSASEAEEEEEPPTPQPVVVEKEKPKKRKSPTEAKEPPTKLANVLKPVGSKSKKPFSFKRNDKNN